MPVPALRWSACVSPLKPVAPPGLFTTGVPRGDGGCSVAALFIRGSRDSMCATPESLAGAARGDAAAPGGSGADVPYKDAEPVVWVGWSALLVVFAAEAPAAGPNATISPVQTAGPAAAAISAGLW